MADKIKQPSGKWTDVKWPASHDEAVLRDAAPERNISRSLISLNLRRALPSEEVLQQITNPLPIIKDVDDEALVKKRASQLVDAYKRVGREQKELEANLDNATNQIAMITAKWNEGVLDLSAGDYKEEKQRMLGRQQQLMTSVSVLRTMGAQLAGRWTDDMVLGEREVLGDWAHIDDTINRYTNVPEATKMILSGSMNLLPLFGAETEHIWNVKNGLVIHKDYERLLDTARAVILPASNDPDETEFKFYLLTSDIGRASTRIWGDMLNGRELIFKNEFRPSKKYLYFKFVISLLRRRRIEVPGFENDLVNLPSPSKVMWASPGSYMKKSILYKFSRQLGCISVEEANRFWEVPEAPTALPAELEDLATTLALTSSSSMSAEISESETGEEADDDDPFAENEGDDDIVNSEDEE